MLVFLLSVVFLILILNPFGLEMSEIKFALMRTQSLTNVFPLKPGVSPYIAMHALPTARN